MFTRPPNPIPGNEDFKHVENLTGQIPLLEVNALRAESVGVNELNLTGSISDNNAYPGSVLHRVVGYAPDDFGTTSATNGVFLNKKPGLAKAGNASAEQLLVLPVGAKLIRTKLTNNGTVITANGSVDFNVGVEEWTATKPTDHSIFKGASLGSSTTAGINNAVGVTVSANEANTGSSLFGTSGTYNLDSVIVVDGKQNVSVTVNTNSLTAGDLALVIEYIM